MAVRNLSTNEIDVLEKNGCEAVDWKAQKFHEPFDPKRFKNVYFSGKNEIGVQNSELDISHGIGYRTGIYNSRIHNCTVADNVLVRDVKLIGAYSIQSGVIIDNVDEIITTGESSFGNGVEIEVLNEGGGRELKIFDRLSAQIAYLLVNYRHDPDFIAGARKLVDRYVESQKSSTGLIAAGAVVRNCGTIKNVKIGAGARVDNALKLENGTIASNQNAPVTVGEGVVADNFIILSGSRVDSSAILHNCFVGQGVQIGKQFSAENSAFFANCEGFHGEACSVFGGPYTVTHHKSTLLIAGMFSFYNAGSGTNQSNHMYKLGPVHQGIMERGAKTGSFSYLLWPGRIGAFSVVVGKHYSNFDTSNLPFSYIVESGGKSVISPAMNLFTVGTRRDSQKWGKRDRRKDPEKLDLIHFDLFSPYVMNKVLNGMDVLQSLYDSASKKQDYVVYNGINLKRLMLKTCRNYYAMTVKIFIGNQLVQLLKSGTNSFEDLKNKLQAAGGDPGKWVDLFGLLAPKSVTDALLERVSQSKIQDIETLQNELKTIYNEYDKYALQWTVALIEKQLEISIDQLTREQVILLIEDWKTNLVRLNHMIINDAQKEFDAKSTIGFGIDGDDSTKQADFDAVRGKIEDNGFIRELQLESADIEQLATQYMSTI